MASLLDGVRASGNRDVHVKMGPTSRGKRFAPLSIPVEEEVRIFAECRCHTDFLTLISSSSFKIQTESNHLKFLQQPPLDKTFAEIVERFNANIPYSGLLHSVTQDVSILHLCFTV